MILFLSAGIWVLLILIYFCIMLRNYTLKDWGINLNPYKHETLGIPKGTIRTILALSMLFMFILTHIYSITFEGIETEAIDNATYLVLGFYFSDRVIEKITNGKKKEN